VVSNDLSVLVRNANPVPTIDHLSDEEFSAALAAIETSLAEHPKRVSPVLQRLRMRPVVVFAAAMAIVALVVAVPLLLLATREGEVTEPTTVTSTIAPTTTAATTTTVPTTTTAVEVVVPPAPEITWTRVPQQPAFENAQIGQWGAAITEGGPGLVAVGHVWERFENLHAAMFVSSDGETWDRIDTPWDRAGDFTILQDVIAGPGGTLVAVGSDPNDAAVWISTDGYMWSKISAGAFGGPDVQGMLGVVVGGPGFVAVGDDGSHAGVWVSPDGYEWSKVEDDDLLAGEDLSVSMYDVAAGGPGLVAVGSAGLWDGDGVTAAVWVSPDGYNWERLPRDTFDAESGDWGMQSMTVHPATGRLIAFGSELWTSTDGRHWVVTELDPLDTSPGAPGAPPAGSEVAWHTNTAVAAGLDMAFSLWVSGDTGSNWSRVEPVEPAFDDFADQAVAVAWFGDRWVVAGAGRDGGVIWIGMPGE
jgi:hypothetical protein